MNNAVQEAYNKYCAARDNAKKFLLPEIAFGEEIPAGSLKTILEEQPEALREERDTYAKYLNLLWKSQEISDDEIVRALSKLGLIDS